MLSRLLFMLLQDVFARFGNIPPQNKNTQVASVHKFCLFKLFLGTLQLKSFENSEFNFDF